MTFSGNKTSYNYAFGGRLDVYGKLTAASDATINGKLNAEGRALFNENVGINVDVPLAKLHISGTADAPCLVLPDTINPRYSVGFGNTNVFNVGQRLDFYVGDSGSNTANLTSAHRRMSLTSQGRLGIGIDNPQRTLDVVGSIRKTEYEPGEIIETLVGVCDGNPVTVKSGTYTLSNVNATQAAGDSYATISGSSIEYTPPAGTTRVCYEFWVYMKDTGSGNNSRPLLHFRSQLDNSSGTATVINNSRSTWRYTHPVDLMDVQTWIYNKVIVSIGQVSTESVANGRLVSWDSARTFRWRFRRYSGSYDADLHETQHSNGTGTNLRVRPHVKITAIA